MIQNEVKIDLENGAAKVLPRDVFGAKTDPKRVPKTIPKPSKNRYRKKSNSENVRLQYSGAGPGARRGIKGEVNLPGGL